MLLDGSDNPNNCRYPRPTQPHKGVSIDSAVFAGLTNVTNKQTDTQTDRPRYSVCSSKPLSLANAAMLPDN